MNEHAKESVAVICTLIVLALGVSPALWLIGKWHCWWFAAAPICQ